ncbi:hypothetical protein [uncultured Intestinimonas sp.]|uniref:hypothetical protein n=1 Tax=uncultured Intestinimonas sp. TaxID=1689265 RepID=UPI0025FEFD92|nr:hypothetical protein [uncultured Intestinimonas sp.]
MKTQNGIFAYKLCELEEEYGRLQSRIYLFQSKDEAQVQKELDQLRDEGREHQLLLDERIRASRSPAVAALAQAQLEFGRRVEQVLHEELPDEMRGRNQTSAEDQSEAMSLFAEYAIDFATQSMRYALIAALSAIALQRKAERKTDTDNKPKGALT